MKKQIERFSPHQNGKVFAVLMALGSLVFVVPFMLIGTMFGPKGMGPPVFLIVVFPIIYLVFGYISVVIGCAVYNFMYKYIGGVEFVSRDADA